MSEPTVLQLVSPPRPVPELLAALRAWEPGGIGSWVLPAQARLPVTAEECRLLAQRVDSFELSALEFERVIALTGATLGLDYRRRLTVGKTIYGKDREVDVLFRDARNGNRLAVEAKYQRVAGTADEKLPYAVLNLTTLPLPGVIVYGGGGFHQGALHWLCANTRATDISRLGDWLTVFFAL
jgi:PD-(D/E)XK nuclease superfamily protein